MYNLKLLVRMTAVVLSLQAVAFTSAFADGSTPTSTGVSAFVELERIAHESISANIHTLSTGSYLSAGSRQFKGLWTRDFSFASRGLNWIGRTDVTREHITRILGFVRKDGLVPRILDSRSVFERYVNLTLGKNVQITEPLKPNYTGGGLNKNFVIDSNSLVLLAALDYVRVTGDQEWWTQHEAELLRVYHCHERFERNGLIYQGKAADWQDSVDRSGATFYTNILHWAASDRLKQYPIFGITQEYVDGLKNKIINTFYDPETSLYFSIAGQPQISLDGILLAIDLGFYPPQSGDAKFLYASLKQHPLWTKNQNIPGYNTYPDYPEHSIEIGPKLVGVRHYHDRIYWSWLMALSAKVAFLMHDFESGDRILATQEQMAIRDGAIVEVFHWDAPFTPFNTSLYRAERPFSWGSGMTLDAVYTRQAQLPVSQQQ